MKQQHQYANQTAARARRKATRVLTILAPVLAMVWLLGGLVWLGEASLAQGTRVTLSPASAQVAVGETVTVDVRVEDVTSLWGARVYLTFDPAILEVVDADSDTEGVQIARGDFIDPREGRSWALVNQADNTAGTVEYASLLLNNARNPTPPASGSGVLARITFRGLAGGNSAVAFSSQDVELYDGQGASILTMTEDGAVIVMGAGHRVFLPAVLKGFGSTVEDAASSPSTTEENPGSPSDVASSAPAAEATLRPLQRETINLNTDPPVLGGLIAEYDDSESPVLAGAVQAIAVDGAGRVWVGTYGHGVGVFDGQTWTEYNQSNSGLVSDNVRAIAVDWDGQVWFGTDSGISVFDGSTWSTYTIANTGNGGAGLRSNDIRGLAVETEREYVWIATAIGVTRYAGATWFTYYQGNSALPADDITDVAVASNGDVWVITGPGSDRVVQLDRATMMWITHDIGWAAGLRALAIDQDDVVWVGTWGADVGDGLYTHDGSQWAHVRHLDDACISALGVDGDNRMWVGTDASCLVASLHYPYGLYVHDRGRWLHWGTGDGIRGNYVHALTAAEGMIWVGTSAAGLNSIALNWARFDTDNSDLPNNRVNALLSAPGRIWAGTAGGATTFDGTTWTSYTTADGLADNRVRAIGACADALWFGTFSGLTQLKEGTWTTYRSDAGLASNLIDALACDARGRVWVGTNQGLSVFDGTDWATFTSPRPLPDDQVNALLRDSQGRMWAGTDAGAAQQAFFNWTTYSASDCLPDNRVTALADEAGRGVWAGTEGGVVVIDQEGACSDPDTGDKLPSDEITALAADTTGRMLVGTTRGAGVFDGVDWRIYNPANSGLLSRSVNAIAVDAVGGTWFGTNQGLFVRGVITSPIGLLEPVITNAIPMSQTAGNRIIIQGQNFDGDRPENTEVFFTGYGGVYDVRATADVRSDTVIWARVPPDAVYGPIKVKTGGFLLGESDFNFSPTPVIASFDPEGASIGSTVKIYGTNLANEYSDVTVIFPGSAEAEARYFSEDAGEYAPHLEVKVPADAEGEGPLQVITEGGQATSRQDFEVTRVVFFDADPDTPGDQFVEINQGHPNYRLVDSKQTLVRVYIGTSSDRRRNPTPVFVDEAVLTITCADPPCGLSAPSIPQVYWGEDLPEEQHQFNNTTQVFSEADNINFYLDTRDLGMRWGTFQFDVELFNGGISLGQVSAEATFEQTSRLKVLLQEVNDSWGDQERAQVVTGLTALQRILPLSSGLRFDPQEERSLYSWGADGGLYYDEVPAVSRIETPLNLDRLTEPLLDAYTWLVYKWWEYDMAEYDLADFWHATCGDGCRYSGDQLPPWPREPDLTIGLAPPNMLTGQSRGAYAPFGVSRPLPGECPIPLGCETWSLGEEALVQIQQSSGGPSGDVGLTGATMADMAARIKFVDEPSGVSRQAFNDLRGYNVPLQQSIGSGQAVMRGKSDEVNGALRTFQYNQLVDYFQDQLAYLEGVWPEALNQAAGAAREGQRWSSEQTQGSGNLFIIGGRVYADDSVEVFASSLMPVHRPGYPPVTPPRLGEYFLVFADGEGNVLGRTMFPVDLTTRDGQPLPFNTFLLIRPFPAGATRVLIRHGQTTLTTLTLSPNPPTVQLLSPNGVENFGRDEEVTITWQGSDPDGDDLTYSLLYASQYITMPVTIVSGLRDTNSFTWDTSMAPGTTAGWITVVASDGFRRAADSSDAPFRLALKPPRLYITSPPDGSVFLRHNRLPLRAVSIDPEEGQAEPSVSWVSDRDGLLGYGSELDVTLSAGTHRLTAVMDVTSGGPITQAVTVLVRRDFDADGMSDSYEKSYVCLDFWDPTDAGEDPDNDGILNVDESNIGTNPCDGDSDDDGVSDGDEVFNNGDPNDAQVQPGPPRLEVQPDRLAFSMRQGGANPHSQHLWVLNTGSGGFHWRVGPDAAWLSVSPDEGNAPAQLQVSVRAGDLDTGIHVGHVSITAPSGVQDNAQTIPVTLTVLSAVEGEVCSLQGDVDVVFVMDTSESMDDEFQALCTSIDRVVEGLEDRGITVRYTVLGITQDKFCATDNVAHRFPNAAADTPEDWGTAVADVAGNFPWAEGAIRLIVPMSDEGPADGDPAEDPGADREVIDAAIEVAQAQQVIVSPVLGSFASDDPANWQAIETLAGDLAQATGGQLLHVTEIGQLEASIANLISSAACAPVLKGVHPNCDVDEETVVSVFGQNFLDDAQVLVDGQPARDATVLQDPERIAFKIPVGLADGTYDVTVVNPGLGQYTLPAALTVGPCTGRCEASQAGDIWTPMWDLWDGKMDLYPVADASGTLTVGLFNGEGTFQVKVYDMEENLLGQMLVAEGETKTVSVPSTEDAEYRVFVAGGEAEHPHFRAFFRGAKRVALPDFGDEWERTEGVPFPGSGVDHGVESNPELGFDERWQDVGNVYADTIWYFHVSQSGAPLRVRIWSEYPEGDGHGGMEWVTPDEITIPLVGPEPAGFYHTFEVPEPQTGWWGLRVKADAPFTPWAQHYSLSHVWTGVGETVPPDYIYLLPASMKAPPCGPSVTLDPPRKGACKSSVVPVDITVSDVNNLYGAEVHLSFDPTKLEVVDATRAVTDVIIPGPFPDPGEGQRLITQNYADNTAGTIDYAMTLLHPAPAAFGEGVLVRILFHVKEPGASIVRFLEGSKLDERPIPPFGPKPIPAQWQGGLVIGRDCIPGQAGQGQIDGQVILQARRNHSGAVVRAAPWPHPQITGADGTYSFAPLSSGAYAMVITHTGYLRTEPLTVTVTAGQPVSVPTAILLGGDVNGDGKINFVDAVIISRAFTYARGEQGYVLAADIDADGVVDLDDLVLVGANWQCTVLDTTPRCRRWRD